MIFRCEDAPDSQTGIEPGISQNISAVFSRIRDIWGSGPLPGKIVFDGDAVQVKEQVLYRFCGEFQIPKQACGGFAVLPLMFHEVVDVHSWMDSTTFINGLALGQVTPGPIVITATFVGYLTYGFWGGVVATIAIFIPSFLFVVGTVPYYDRLQGSQLYKKMFQGILFSFVGLLLSVTIKLVLAVPWSWFPGLLAAGAFLSLLWGAEILWVVIAGVVIALVMFLIVH